MKLSLSQDRLLPGTQLSDGVLTMPPEGGGILLPEIRESGARYLNLNMEVLNDHAQAFELRLYGEEISPRVIVRFGLMPAFHAQAALDLNWMDGHILFPGHRVGTQKVVCHGSRIERKEIRKAELVSMASFDPVKVRVNEISLLDEALPPILPSNEILIDAFGQYAKKDWPGKIREEAALIQDLQREEKKESLYPFPEFTPWGGCAKMPLGEGTGFFSKVKKEDRWYLLDPSGCAFFSMGPDCVTARCDARIDGLEENLSPLPSPGEFPEGYEPMRRNFGEIRREGVMFSYERLNLKRAFGENWYEAWQRMITGQLKRMGMNTLGNWSDENLFGRMPYVASLPEFPATRHLIFRDFPDVLSPEYRENAKRCATALEKRKNDPWMIGYFLRNEPAWAFVDDLIIADEVLRDEEDTACKEALIQWLREKYQTPDGLSRAWEWEIASFDELKKPVEKASSLSARAKEDMRAFSAHLTAAYTRIPAAACREIDRHHMILGMRWAWISDPLLVSGWDCFDVFSINCYAVDPTPALDNVAKLGVDLPIMIGEFHFGALDAGLPATGLEAVRDQEERAKAYRYYCERAAAHPNGVGCHWFQCYDQFALGRFDGENYNIGLMDITLRPYEKMAKAIKATAGRIFEVKAGKAAPFDQRPESLPMIAY